MTRSPPWSDSENRALIALYFHMLDKATAGQSYNKAAMIRQANGETYRAPNGSYYDENRNAIAAPPLSARTKQSIEFKLMNATAAHQSIDPEAETMHGHGYVPLANMQASLKDAMATKIETRRRCYIGNDGKRYA